MNKNKMPNRRTTNSTMRGIGRKYYKNGCRDIGKIKRNPIQRFKLPSKIIECPTCLKKFLPSIRKQGGGLKQKFCSTKCCKKSWYLKKKNDPFYKKIRKRKNKIYNKNRRELLTAEYKLWSSAKRRAKEKGLDFTILPSDIIIPKNCPLLGIPIVINKQKTFYDCPSLDRIKPHIGYVKNNIWVISHKANSAKNDLNINQLRMLVKNLEYKIKK